MGKQAIHKVAPVVRAAFLRALGNIEETEGLTFSQISQKAIQEQGIVFGFYNCKFNGIDLPDQFRCFITMIIFREVRADAFSDILCLADIQQLFTCTIVLINTRRIWKCLL